jgi:hypothetical protein
MRTAILLLLFTVVEGAAKAGFDDGIKASSSEPKTRGESLYSCAG